MSWALHYVTQVYKYLLVRWCNTFFLSADIRADITMPENYEELILHIKENQKIVK